jgi:hypothetical protein
MITKRKPPKGRSTVSKADSYEGMGAYWDAHDVPPADAKAKPVELAVAIRRRQYLVAIEPKLFARVRRRAAKQGMSAEDLLNLWAREKCAASR